MILKSATCVLVFLFLFCALIDDIGCKRGGGRRGGTYGRSSSVWGRNKQSSSNYDSHNRRGKQTDAVPAVAPAAAANPKTASADLISHEKTAGASASSNTKKTASSDFIQHEKTQASNTAAQKPSAPEGPSSDKRLTQSEPGNQKPIGWDAGNKKSEGEITRQSGWNVANGNPPAYSAGGHANPPAYSPGGYGNPPGYSAGNTGQGYPPSYSAGSYGNAGSYPSGANYGNPPAYSAGNYHGGYQQNAGAYPNPNSGVGGYYGGGYQQPHGQYPQQNMYSPQGPYNNMGGYGGNAYGHSSGGGGLVGSMFGGNKYGTHGGYGGYGGYGGNGMGGYGKQYGGGFGSGFGKHAIRNVIVGMLVWNLVSGLTRRPYYVYNYYNNPEKVPEEIPLPANSIVLCAENVNTLCAPNTAPLCTQDGKIMCVVLAQQTVPCDNNSTMKCVNSTVTCTEGTEDGCTGVKSTPTTVNIPCVTNATIIGKMLDNTTMALSGTGTLLKPGDLGDATNLCVTTFAMPQPENEIATNDAKPCDSVEAVDNNNSTVPCVNVTSPALLPPINETTTLLLPINETTTATNI